jgi:hypothetical protein
MKRITSAVLTCWPPARRPLRASRPRAVRRACRRQDCNADGLQDLVGRPATAELGAEALRRSSRGRCAGSARTA